MQTDKPILFQGPLVRAIFADRKTQTRRLFKVTDPMGQKHAIGPHEKIIQLGAPGEIDDFHYESTGGLSGPYPCPYGQPGGTLWVRENWAIASKAVDLTKVYYQAHERASHTEFHEMFPTELAKGYPATWPRWKPSIHMPRWACRLELDLLNVRCEPLQAITEEDALAEGIVDFGVHEATGQRMFAPMGAVIRSGENTLTADIAQIATSAVDAFRILWNSINATPKPVYETGPDGKKAIKYYISYPWDEVEWQQPPHRGKPHYAMGNPWVWVLDFKRKESK